MCAEHQEQHVHHLGSHSTCVPRSMEGQVEEALCCLSFT